MTTAKTTPTEEYFDAGHDQAQGKATIDHAEARGEQSVEGKVQKAEGVATAQKEPNLAMNDVMNVAE